MKYLRLPMKKFGAFAVSIGGCVLLVSSWIIAWMLIAQILELLARIMPQTAQ